MRNQLWILGAALLVCACQAVARKPAAKYTSMEVKRFSRAEGVELPPDFSDLLYAQIRKLAQNSGKFGQIVSEGEVVDPSEASNALVLEGTLSHYNAGSATKEVLVPYVGMFKYRRSLTVDVSVRRRSDNDMLFQKQIKIRLTASLPPDTLALMTARQIIRELRRRT